jgi:hypothetical protein
MRVKANLRHELKYLIDLEQMNRVREAIEATMVPDAHGDRQGAYQISSLYYDTPDYKAYWDKIEGHKIRRKVRVRVYGGQVMGPETPAFVEIKARQDKLMAKRRARLPYGQAIDFDGFEGRPSNERAGNAATGEMTGDSAVLSEVFYLYRTLQLRPAAVVTYDRLAYEGGEHFPDLRVTFDTNLRGRVHDLSLLSLGQAADEYFLPPDRCVLEVKVNRTAPYWLTRILSDHRCTLRRVSKYCMALETGAVIRNRQRIIETQPMLTQP